MQALISERYKFVYYWLPKCGCSTLKAWFAEIHGIKYFNNNQLHSIRTRIPAGWKDYYKFMVVRNPWERIVSTYIYLNTANHASLKKIGKDLSFEEFINTLKNNPIPLQENWHLIPQSAVYPNAQPDRIIRLENLDDAMQEICKKLGINQRPITRNMGLNRMLTNEPCSEYNKPIYKMKFSEFYLKQEVSDPNFYSYVLRHTPDWKLFYNDELEQIVADFYHQDIQHFGFSKVLP